ncbi:pentapeptide repeat-containing protein [Flavobacterium geliluteum]|uniref:Pentapeptide repeat-containing protein n=1 Tax=Flavobacterium geliluteum TaxID=2816120 RepID=A0A940X6P5_9FLAO|nr:pentapeptide repeat-containing protein [Flavobacterium geliluteum]MBP4136741.1 pentapeptide repeat-containing protein [Flavobacterium geliluteum]
MLTNFFKLNEPYRIIKTQIEFDDLLKISKSLINILYEPANLAPNSEHPKLKIKDTSFQNVSFSKTKLDEVIFINCKFEDCLFIGCEIVNCEFHNCNFINSNTHKILIRNTYVNPESFSNCIKKIDNANIGVHLFQQLLNNSNDAGQSKFSRLSEYHFKKWEDKLTLNKFWNKKPYPISFWKFILNYPFRWSFRYTFGYGLRLRNFALTFAVVFISFFFINQSNWKSYELEKKDLTINVFCKDSANVSSNIYYTLDATTKLVDSQFQATSNEGMVWLTIQNLCGFILLSALITIILNRFVK